MVLLVSKVITTSGTPVQLSTTQIPAASVTVSCPQSNTGAIIVGDSTVLYSTRKGINILPGDSFTFPYIGAPGAYNLIQMYVDAQISGEKAIATVCR